jgi:hypothetical protein
MKRNESQINSIDFGASLNAESTLLPVGMITKGKQEDMFNSRPLSQQQAKPNFAPVYDDNSFKNKENKQ